MNKETTAAADAMTAQPGLRAKKIHERLAQDPARGKLLLDGLKAEAQAPQALEARVELALLQQMMQTGRRDALTAIASMRVAAGMPVH